MAKKEAATGSELEGEIIQATELPSILSCDFANGHPHSSSYISHLHSIIG